MCILFSQSCTANVIQLTNALTTLQEKLRDLQAQLSVNPEPREGKAVSRDQFFKDITGFDELFFTLLCKTATYQIQFLPIYFELNHHYLPLSDGKKWGKEKEFTAHDWDTFRNECFAKFFDPGEDKKDPEKDIPHKIKKLKAENGALIETGERYQAGRFYEFSLEYLDKKVKEKEVKEGKIAAQGTFNIIQRGHDPAYKLTTFVDTGSLQAKIENRGAVFQVASQFNGYEATGVYSPEAAGITSFTSDLTQGPVASISATPGTIQRIDYVFYNKTTDPVSWRQTKNKQIELLDKTPLKVTHGYVDLNQSNPDLTEQDYKNIKIGFQKDTQVTFGLMNGKSNMHIPINDPQQIIHQVFTAAVNCGNTSGATNVEIYKGSNGDAAQKTAIKTAQRILDAAYEGTIKVAYAFGKKKVFLTLIGGGAFQNQLSWILGAINKNIPFIKAKGLEVYLVIFSATSGLNPTFIDQLQTEMPTLLKMVAETGGTYSLHYIDNSDKPEKKILKTEQDIKDVQEVVA